MPPVHEKEEQSTEEAQNEQALGRSRGGFTSKLHLICDQLGNPLWFIVTAGNVHDSTAQNTYVSFAISLDLCQLSQNAGISRAENKERQALIKVSIRNAILSSAAFLGSKNVGALLRDSKNWPSHMWRW